MAIPLSICGFLSSCDSVFDDSDCVASYNLVKFTYDYNLKFADAFNSEVKRITLLAINTRTGQLAKRIQMSKEQLLPGNELALELEPGGYDLIVWGGSYDNHYAIAEGKINESVSDDFHCRLKLDADGESSDDIAHLYHALVHVNLPYASSSKPNNITVNLTKDTNTVRVVLQHLSGEPVDADKFEFVITDGNSWLNFDNSLRDNTRFIYRPHYTFSGTVDVNTDPIDPDTGNPVNKSSRAALGASLAEFTISRLFTDNEPILSVRNIATGKNVLSVNINDYALLVRGITHSKMDAQEYLDRQDEYNMTFFLDQSGSWLSNVVIINNWRIVRVNQDIQ